VRKLLAVAKKEPVLLIALALGIGSFVLVPPSSKTIGFIDFKVLCCLASLMLCVSSLKAQKAFDKLAGFLLSKTRRPFPIALILVGLCFFSSMLITNDVSLLTFVGFAIVLLPPSSGLLIPVIVLQTIAANLGSTITVMGNPQNLYLCSYYDLTSLDLLRIMGPYAALSLALLVLCCWLLTRGKDPIQTIETVKEPISLYSLALSLSMFIISLLGVFKVLDYKLCLGIVSLSFFIQGLLDRKNGINIFKGIDWTLLLTFVGFFLFTGNLGSLEKVASWIRGILEGHVLAVSLASSQALSNVPTALLLSSFTGEGASLLLGVNLGGLGTLIASLASVISYKLYSQSEQAQGGRYMLVFTAYNAAFLVALLGLRILL